MKVIRGHKKMKTDLDSKLSSYTLFFPIFSREWKTLCTHNTNFSVRLQTWLGGDRPSHISGGPYILKQCYADLNKRGCLITVVMQVQ